VNDITEETVDITSRRNQFSIWLILLRGQREADIEVTRWKSLCRLNVVCENIETSLTEVGVFGSVVDGMVLMLSLDGHEEVQLTMYLRDTRAYGHSDGWDSSSP
jgi:hypothetical protein